MKFIGGSLNVAAASYIVSNEIAKHGKPSSDGQLIKQACLNVRQFYLQILKKKKKLFKE